MPSRHVIAFRHIELEDVGNIRPALESRGLSLQCVDLYRGDAVPDVSTASGLIFMGGPMSVNDDLPYLRREEQLIRRAIAAGQPVLGVCLGAQLIANAMGGKVYANPMKEIGWYTIQLTGAAQQDPLFSGLGTAHSVFQWHGETFDLPCDAVLLATSDTCRHQAFRLGASTYGVQFHPEMTPAMVRDWCEYDRTCVPVREAQHEIDPCLHAEELAQLCDGLIERWIGLLP